MAEHFKRRFVGAAQKLHNIKPVDSSPKVHLDKVRTVDRKLGECDINNMLAFQA